MNGAGGACGRRCRARRPGRAGPGRAGPGRAGPGRFRSVRFRKGRHARQESRRTADTPDGASAIVPVLFGE
ncbi:hypothetical protein GCM10010346_04470 [Streptomyces chryseus]|uniref:Uncharacterized protein n=1 Tax=Streptomyces chryseus TaxID=68186 RepID=A0ABQ3DGK0_9ACTN|nr:hypothetical protein GCM10010346_04470 [Streptomyces chryseus]